MRKNPLKELACFGQSIWLDYIRRDLIAGGELKRLIDEDGILGMTSNPSIFEQALAESADYDGDIRAMSCKGKGITEIYDYLSINDVKNAADAFRGVYNDTNGKDGYVSLEVNPHLAYDAKGTIEEARKLWGELDRPNVLVKIPATADGIIAIPQLISEGININVTLIFGLSRYEQVIEGYIAGIEKLASSGKALKNVTSVASFFVSRIDSLIDPLLEKQSSQAVGNLSINQQMYGQIGIASCKMAYQIYKKSFSDRRFLELANKGAQTQRLLWASTGTKNENYSDIKYIEALIGKDTINTIPLKTLNAYREHGNPMARLEEDVDWASWALGCLPDLGINIDKLTHQLEQEGVAKFVQSFDSLINAMRKTASTRAL